MNDRPRVVIDFRKDLEQPKEDLKVVERIVVREDALPASCWDGDQGIHVLPPPPPPSKRVQTLLGVQASLAAMWHDQDARRPQLAALLDPIRPRTGSDAAGQG